MCVCLLFPGSHIHTHTYIRTPTFTRTHWHTQTTPHTYTRHHNTPNHFCSCALDGSPCAHTHKHKHKTGSNSSFSDTSSENPSSLSTHTHTHPTVCASDKRGHRLASGPRQEQFPKRIGRYFDPKSHKIGKHLKNCP